MAAEVAEEVVVLVGAAVHLGARVAQKHVLGLLCEERLADAELGEGAANMVERLGRVLSVSSVVE